MIRLEGMEGIVPAFLKTASTGKFISSSTKVFCEIPVIREMLGKAITDSCISKDSYGCIRFTLHRKWGSIHIGCGGFAEPCTFMDTTYDVAAANKLLDEMGMTKGTDGFRVGPDGKKFTIPFEVYARA